MSDHSAIEMGIDRHGPRLMPERDPDRTKGRHLLRFVNAAKHPEWAVVHHMRQRFFPDRESDADAPLVEVDEVSDAWPVARLGVIVRCPDWPDVDRARALIDMQPVYDVVHLFQPLGPLDVLLLDGGCCWLDQERAFNNGYDLVVFRHGSQKHVRRGTQL
jgi:hypothetical protein